MPQSETQHQQHQQQQHQQHQQQQPKVADGAALCLTFSWRGAQIGRSGRHKSDGKAWLRHYAQRLDAEVRAVAAQGGGGGGLELREVEPPRQCGQLFFLAYTVHASAGAGA